MRAGTFIPILAAMTLAVTVPHTAAAQDHDSNPGQSIQVHGHWIIEVYDGEELVERREFENGLMTVADEIIADLLGGHATPGGWMIDVETCAIDQGSAISCPIAATVTSPSGGDRAGALVIEGATVIEDDGSAPDVSLAIERVTTGVGLCDAAVAPADCADQKRANFTMRTLDTPIDVSAGQDVNITVIISFTSG